MWKLLFYWVLQTFNYKVVPYTRKKGKPVDFIFLKKARGRTRVYQFWFCYKSFFCNIVHDHLHALLIFMFVSSVLCSSNKYKLTPSLCEFIVLFNCMCQFTQISPSTVITTKGHDIKNIDRKANKSLCEEYECKY